MLHGTKSHGQNFTIDCDFNEMRVLLKSCILFFLSVRENRVDIQVNL